MRLDHLTDLIDLTTTTDRRATADLRAQLDAARAEAAAWEARAFEARAQLAAATAHVVEYARAALTDRHADAQCPEAAPLMTGGHYVTAPASTVGRRVSMGGVVLTDRRDGDEHRLVETLYPTDRACQRALATAQRATKKSGFPLWDDVYTGDHDSGGFVLTTERLS